MTTGEDAGLRAGAGEGGLSTAGEAAAPPWCRREGAIGSGFASIAAAGVVAAVLVLGGAGGASVAAAADPFTINGMYEPPSNTSIGAALNTGSGGASAPGSPAPGPGCAPAIQAPHGAAYMAGVQNHMTISQSARKPPGKILTTCISTLITLMSSLDIFSNAGPFSLDMLENALISYGETLICQEIATEFNALMSEAFNSIAFLKDVVPCGVNMKIPSMNTGSNAFCQAIGGPMVNIGVNPTVYATGSVGASQTSLQGSVGNALQLLQQ